jgi:hypothetical protein
MAGSWSVVPPGRPTPRALWSWFETIHAVTYFSSTCQEALVATGLR